jgi:hypothetical protein
MKMDSSSLSLYCTLIDWLMALLYLTLSIILLLNHREHLFDELIAAVITWTCAYSCYIRTFDYTPNDPVARGLVVLSTKVGLAHIIIMVSVT